MAHSNTASCSRPRGRALLLLCTLGACATTGPVSLSGAWPQTPGSYGEVQRAWTRHGSIRDGYDQVLSVHATFKSPAWRAAYVEHMARNQRLPGNERQMLVEQSQKAVSEGPYEVELLVTTYDWRENDLNKGERSIWRIALVDDRGNEVEPVSIQRDRRPREVVRAEFPDLDDFAVPYIVRFPRTIEVLRPDARKFSLKMASSRGAVELVWQGR